MLNPSIAYHDDVLHSDGVSLDDIAASAGTPAYIYSLPRALANYERIASAFAGLKRHIHYSAKANANLQVMRALIDAGAGIDAVSAGEIYKAIAAGCDAAQIVFAGVGKTRDELHYALEKCVGWINVENAAELDHMQAIAAELGSNGVRVALRLNPEVTASTHPYIATGHGGAKFGLTAATITQILADQGRWPRLHFAGIHVHIGSQLHDTDATVQAVQAAVDLAQPHPAIRTINIGGGLPVAYEPGESLPDMAEFAGALQPLLEDYDVILEPGRSIIADAGVLLAQILYVKEQAGQTFYIVDASIAELIRPALYQAHHEIVPLIRRPDAVLQPVNVVGPVCETADVLRRQVMLPQMQPGERLAILTAGAYGMVMASNYNARLRPPEIVTDANGWHIARPRESLADLIAGE